MLLETFVTVTPGSLKRRHVHVEPTKAVASAQVPVVKSHPTPNATAIVLKPEAGSSLLHLPSPTNGSYWQNLIRISCHEKLANAICSLLFHKNTQQRPEGRMRPESIQTHVQHRRQYAIVPTKSGFSSIMRNGCYSSTHTLSTGPYCFLQHIAMG